MSTSSTAEPNSKFWQYNSAIAGSYQVPRRILPKKAPSGQGGAFSYPRYLIRNHEAGCYLCNRKKLLHESMADHLKPRKTYTDITLPDMKRMQARPGTVIVDVREPWEFDEFNEGGINIPLSAIREKRDQLEEYDTIIVICTNGTRSKVAAMDYCRVPAWAGKTIYHLQGGILEAE